MTDSTEPPTEAAIEDEIEDAGSPAELAKYVVVDGVVAAIAGAGGNVVVLAALGLAAQLNGFDPASFSTAAELLGLGALFTEAQLLIVGLALFVLGGMTVLPLLLATVGSYLPGRNTAERGTVFGAIVWTGFVLAYYPGFAGASLGVYAILSLLGHLGYGYVTGRLMDALFSAQGRPVIAGEAGAPAARTAATADPDDRPRSTETTLVDDTDESEA